MGSFFFLFGLDFLLFGLELLLDLSFGLFLVNLHDIFVLQHVCQADLLRHELATFTPK